MTDTHSATPSREAPAPAANGRAVVSLSAGRFPWVSEFQDRYGVDKAQWRALIDAVFPNAKTLDSVILALSYCKARGLDVFKRPVHIVPMWSSAANNGKGGMVDTIWPGIGELRTTATRTKSYAGRDATIYGPDVTEQYGDAEVTHPEWCEVVVYRIVAGHRVAFHGPRVYWRETYATKAHNSDTPNSMWLSRPFGQIEKCGEAAAIRAAFPEEAGNEYTADEMEGKVIEGRFAEVPHAEPIANKQPTGDKLAAFAGDAQPPPPEDEPDDQAAISRATVKAVLEQIESASTPKAFKAVRLEAIKHMGALDETWPEGKDQIVSALAAAEERLAPKSEGARQ